MYLFIRNHCFFIYNICTNNKKVKFRLNIEHNDIKIKLSKEIMTLINFKMNKFRNSNMKKFLKINIKKFICSNMKNLKNSNMNKFISSNMKKFI